METALFSIKRSYATWCQWVSKTRTPCTTSLSPHLPPPPLHSPQYCMVTKHADRQNKSRQPGLCSCLWRLTSAPDKLHQPCPLQLLRAHSGLSVCKLCNRHIDICICTLHAATSPFYSCHPPARVNTQGKHIHLSGMKLDLQFTIVWPCLYILDYTLLEELCRAPAEKGGGITFKALISLKRLLIVWFHTLLAREAARAVTWHCKMSYWLKKKS